MKKKYLTIAVLCIASLFASCNQDQATNVPAFGEEVEVEMNVLASSMGQTRAAIDAEAKINNLCILVFDAGDAPAGATEEQIEAASKFLYYRHAWNNTAGGQNTYRTVLKTGSNLRIYLTANAKDLIEGANLLENDSYDIVRKKLTLTNPKELIYNNLPMWGIVSGLTTISESDIFVQLGNIKLLRSVASADLTITDMSFELENARIVLATNKGYLGHEAGNVSEVSGALRISLPCVPDGTDYNFGNDFLWKQLPTINTDNREIVNKFYMFENDATALTAPSKRYTKLIVEGKYNGGSSTYYPLAFRDNDNKKVQTARNRKFEITVKKVTGPGYTDIDDAINSEDVNMAYEVVAWDDGYKDSDIIVDGLYYVSFSGDKTILLANEANSDAMCWFSTNALEWEGASPKNLVWSFNNFTTEIKTGTISNNRFKVEILKEKPSDPNDENYYLKITALEDYKKDDAGSHTATLYIKMGRIQFEIHLRQVENGYVDGGNENVDL